MFFEALFSALVANAGVPASGNPAEPLGRDDGAHPIATLIGGKDGVLYGTTPDGTAPDCQDCGTVFKLMPTGASYVESIVYRFANARDGEGPKGGLTFGADGALYGTTASSGVASDSCNVETSAATVDHSCGTVFKLTLSAAGYTASIVYSFKGGLDGRDPYATLVADKSGALYGTTYHGGAACPDADDGSTCGVVFMLTPSGAGYSERVLHRFRGGSDGAFPMAGLAIGGDGSLFGTTVAGGGTSCRSDFGNGCGVAFELTPNGTAYTETVLYRFRGGQDGANPIAGLVAAEDGTLYGTTFVGGGKSCRNEGAGCGTAFALSRSGAKYAETIVYRFVGGEDSAGSAASLVLGQGGVLYGTSHGDGPCRAEFLHGCGTVFELTRSGAGYAERVLYRFKGTPDGAGPLAGLFADGSGAFYGATVEGGSGACGSGSACGTVYKLTPSGDAYTESVLHSFTGGAAPEPS